jgi:hypothetical protein
MGNKRKVCKIILINIMELCTPKIEDKFAANTFKNQHKWAGVYLLNLV